MVQVAIHRRQQPPAGAITLRKTQTSGPVEEFPQPFGVQPLGLQHVLMLLVRLGQQLARDQPVGKPLQCLPCIGLRIENDHEQQGQLPADPVDGGTGRRRVEPRKSPVIHAQRVAQRREQQRVIGLVPFQLGPQRRIGHAVQVPARQKEPEQRVQRGERPQRGGQGRRCGSVHGKQGKQEKWGSQVQMASCPDSRFMLVRSKSGIFLGCAHPRE